MHTDVLAKHRKTKTNVGIVLCFKINCFKMLFTYYHTSEDRMLHVVALCMSY